MKIRYKKLVQLNKIEARIIVMDKLQKNNGNVKKHLNSLKLIRKLCENGGTDMKNMEKTG
jgi:hypothetical protein